MKFFTFLVLIAQIAFGQNYLINPIDHGRQHKVAVEVQCELCGKYINQIQDKQPSDTWGLMDRGFAWDSGIYPEVPDSLLIRTIVIPLKNLLICRECFIKYSEEIADVFKDYNCLIEKIRKNNEELFKFHASVKKNQQVQGIKNQIEDLNRQIEEIKHPKPKSGRFYFRQNILYLDTLNKNLKLDTVGTIPRKLLMDSLKVK